MVTECLASLLLDFVISEDLSIPVDQDEALVDLPELELDRLLDLHGHPLPLHVLIEVEFGKNQSHALGLPREPVLLHRAPICRVDEGKEPVLLIILDLLLGDLDEE